MILAKTFRNGIWYFGLCLLHVDNSNIYKSNYKFEYHKIIKFGFMYLVYLYYKYYIQNCILLHFSFFIAFSRFCFRAKFIYISLRRTLQNCIFKFNLCICYWIYKHFTHTQIDTTISCNFMLWCITLYFSVPSNL